MEEVIVDSQRKYYSPVWYDSVLLKSCRDSWQHVANSVAAGVPAKVIGERTRNLAYKTCFSPFFDTDVFDESNV